MKICVHPFAFCSVFLKGSQFTAKDVAMLEQLHACMSIGPFPQDHSASPLRGNYRSLCKNLYTNT